ncbi:hypothetical protein ACB098_01G178800 [Castanea mollissima]
MAHNMLLTLSYRFQLIYPSPNSTQITFDILYQSPHITLKWNTRCIGCTNNIRQYFFIKHVECFLQRLSLQTYTWVYMYFQESKSLKKNENKQTKIFREK